jgi:CubicO group peptidase (beta-lactamase class C family)
MNFKPVDVKSRLPDPATQPWPMGDMLPRDPLPTEIDAEKLKAAVNAAFQPAEGLTAAFVVTWKGRLIAERYAEGVTAQTPLEGWSMGKSITATLFGILVKDGVYDLDQPAPIPEWQTPGDPRAKIRIADLLHMSSGLRIKAPQDPDYDPTGPYGSRLSLYRRHRSFHYAQHAIAMASPTRSDAIATPDPVLISYLIRSASKKRRRVSFISQRALFDKLGIRTMVVETDPFGNF